MRDVAIVGFAQSPSQPDRVHNEVEILTPVIAEAVKREFGAHLDDAELDAVKKELARNLGSAARLREAARLGNADEPVSRFEARPPGSPEKGGRR